MKLNYLKITDNRYKFFYEGKDGAYGEFYMEINPDKTNGGKTAASGSAEIFMKDPDYAGVLTVAFMEAVRGGVMCPTCKQFKSGEIDKEAIDKLGECAGCDHVRGEIGPMLANEID